MDAEFSVTSDFGIKSPRLFEIILRFQAAFWLLHGGGRLKFIPRPTSMAADTPPPPKLMRLCLGLMADVGRNADCSQQGMLNGCARNTQTGAAAFYFFCCPSCRAKIADGSMQVPDASGGGQHLSQYIYIP